MFHSKRTKQNPYLLHLFTPWIFCRFLKFPENVKSPLTILWNCLHERCFKLHTSFRLEAGSTRKVSLSFWFVAASRKKSFHISKRSHSLELCNLYQFLKRLIVLQVAKYFMIHQFTINCIWFMLFSRELEQVLVLVKQFTSASSIETFLSSRYYSHVSSFSQLVVCKRRNLVKAFKFSKWSSPKPDVKHKTCAIQIYLTWMNHSHDHCLRWIFLVQI